MCIKPVGVARPVGVVRPIGAARDSPRAPEFWAAAFWRAAPLDTVPSLHTPPDPPCEPVPAFPAPQLEAPQLEAPPLATLRGAVVWAFVDLLPQELELFDKPKLPCALAELSSNAHPAATSKTPEKLLKVVPFTRHILVKVTLQNLPQPLRLPSNCAPDSPERAPKTIA
jgi:hypothetical protein